MSEVLPGVWRSEALHPEWTEDEGGEEGWEQLVAWFAVRSSRGLVLIDPLVDDWPTVDRLVSENGGCAGIVRTIHWHERSVDAASRRYDAEVSASPGLKDGDEIFGGMRVTEMERDDEIALWLAEQNALLFADAMLRRPSGELRMCPESWRQPEGGRARLCEILRGLTELPVKHVLVAHGPLVLGDGAAALRSALG